MPRRRRSRRRARLGQVAMLPPRHRPLQSPRSAAPVGNPGAQRRLLGPNKKAKVDQILLLPIPEANTRLAALRSGRVDWIECRRPTASRR